MTYPQTAGFQAHSETSRKAAERITTAESMERDIESLLDTYESGFTGDELAAHLKERGYPSIQTGTVAARLRGLELKHRAVKLQETRLTRSKRPAHVWVAPRLVRGRATAAVAKTPCVVELQQRIVRLELENSQLRKRLAQ